MSKKIEQAVTILITCSTRQDPRLVKNAIRTLAREAGADWTDFVCFLIDSLDSVRCRKKYFLHREPQPFAWSVSVGRSSRRTRRIRA